MHWELLRSSARSCVIPNNKRHLPFLISIPRSVQIFTVLSVQKSQAAPFTTKVNLIMIIK